MTGPVPDNDAPVDDEVLLYRLVPCEQCDFADGEWRFQSGAFDNSSDSDGMSVVLGDTLAALERTPSDLPETVVNWPEAKDPDRFGVAVLQTKFVRDNEQQEVVRTPVEIEDAHGDVRGEKNRARRKRLKKHAEQVGWIVAPRVEPDEVGLIA